MQPLRYMRILIAILAFMWIGLVPSSAQLGLGLALVIDDETVPDGWYSVVLRYYSSATDTKSLADETLSVRFSGGRCHVVCGLTTQLPEAFRSSSTAAIGYSIDGGQERVPRIQVASQHYAARAEHALLADGLSPSFTGFVTSINELAGPVTLVGADGISIDRQGSTMVLRLQKMSPVRGRIRGDNTTHFFTISPGVALSSRTRVTLALVNSTTQIALSASINLAAGTITVTAAAPLLESEQIEWEVFE